LSRVVNEQPIDTIAIEWEVGEEVKVLIAHRNDDDEATLHAVNLTPEQRDAMLVRYVSAIDRAAKIGPLVVSCGTQQSESLVVVEPGGHVGRLPLSLSTCPRGGCQEHGNECWSGGAVHQRVGPSATVGG
jgi:hypothetical protein